MKNLSLVSSSRTFAVMFGAVPCAMLMPLPANAEPAAVPASIQLPEIRVVARLDDPAQDQIGPVRSLDQADIDAQAPVSIVESLSLLPGIDAFEKGGLGAGSYVSIRGGEPNFALVVINGVRVNDPMQSSGGGFDFSLIDPGDVARADVLSGPYSTAYGADALSGVVSLRLATPRSEPTASAHIGTGSGGRYGVGGRVALSGKAGSLMAAASASDTNDFLAGSQAERQSAMATASPRLGDDVALDLFGFYGASQSRGFPEDSGGPDLAVIRTLETRDRRQIALGATASARLSPAFTAQMRLSWGRSDLKADSPGIAPGKIDGVPPITTDSRFDRLEAVTSLSWIPDSWFSSSAGASFVREDGKSDGIVDFGFPIPASYRQKRSLPGLFATAAFAHPSGAALRAGLRVDFPERGKSRWTPRLGAEVPLGQSGLTVSANYARSFKQPSLFALGYPLAANPNLKDELSTTYDAGLGWASKDETWQASVTAYRSVFRNLIDFDPDLFTHVNRQRVATKGLEFSLSGKVRAFRILANLTYLSSHSADDVLLRFRPHWKGRAAVEWRAGNSVTMRLDAQFVSAFYDSTVPTGFKKLDAFETFGAEVGWKLSQNLEIRAVLRNLANENYSRTIGTPEPGRNFFLTLRGTL